MIFGVLVYNNGGKEEYWQTLATPHQATTR